MTVTVTRFKTEFHLHMGPRRLVARETLPRRCIPRQVNDASTSLLAPSWPLATPLLSRLTTRITRRSSHRRLRVSMANAASRLPLDVNCSDSCGCTQFGLVPEPLLLRLGSASAQVLLSQLTDPTTCAKLCTIANGCTLTDGTSERSVSFDWP